MPATRAFSAFSLQLVAYIAAFLPLSTSGPTTARFPPSAMTSTPPRLQCWMRLLTRRSRFTRLARPKDGSGAGDALARPTSWPPAPAQAPPQWRGERRWGCDASAYPGTGSVGQRGSLRPHHGGGRRRPADIANRDLGDVARRGPGVGHTTSSLQPSPLIGQACLCWRVYSQ